MDFATTLYSFNKLIFEILGIWGGPSCGDIIGLSGS